MTKYVVERYATASGRWDVFGSFISEGEARTFFTRTAHAHPDWVLRRITVHESHDGTSASPVLQRRAP